MENDPQFKAWAADTVKKPLAYGERSQYKSREVDLEMWRQLGQGAHSHETAIEVTFNEEMLTLSIRMEETEKLPAWSNYPENLPPGTTLEHPGPNRRTIPGFAPLNLLLTQDLLGRQRKKFSVGPLVDPPLDGTPVSVDPRITLPGSAQ